MVVLYTKFKKIGQSWLLNMSVNVDVYKTKTIWCHGDKSF